MRFHGIPIAIAMRVAVLAFPGILILLVSLATLATAQDKPGWTMLWSDEFTGPAINAAKWTFEVGPVNVNQELEYYSNSQKNAFIEDGSLVIRAIKESVGGRNYTSSKLHTRMKGDWLYGRIEVRAKLNQGKGIWPAIWMMPTDNAYGGWPSSGEMDIMELLGHQPAKVYGTVHWNSGGHQQQGSSKTLPAGTFADDYHVFAYEWEAGQQRWYIDDVQYFATAKGQPFDKRFYLILNLAVGGSWPGNPDGTTPFPNDMRVDFVRVYKKSGILGLRSDRLPPGFAVASNPFRHEALVTNGPMEVEITLRDMAGKVVERRRLAAEATAALGAGMPEGVYTLEVRTGGARHFARLLKSSR